MVVEYWRSWPPRDLYSLLFSDRPITSSFTKPIFYRYFYSRGVALPVLVFYESGGAFLGNLLLAAICERYEKWSVLGVRDIVYSILCSPFGGAVPQNLCVLSFAFASPKLASMIPITVPAFTYVLNVIIRKEKLSRSIPCVVKVVSVVLGPIAIAVIVFFMNEGSLAAQSKSTTSSVLLGTLLCFMSSNICAWLTNQLQETRTNLAYTYTLAALISFPGALVAMIIAICLYHDMKYYNLALDSITLRVSAGGTVLVSVGATFARTWCVQTKGTSYVAAFSNISLLLDTFAAPLILKGKIELGSVLSSVLLAICLGAFHWATTKEEAAELLASETQKEVEIVVTPTGEEHLASTAEAIMDVVVITAAAIDADADVVVVAPVDVDVDVDVAVAVDADVITDADAVVVVAAAVDVHVHVAVVADADVVAVAIVDVDNYASTGEVSKESDGEQGTKGTIDDQHQGMDGEVLAADDHGSESREDYGTGSMNDVLGNQVARPLEVSAEYLIELASFL